MYMHAWYSGFVIRCVYSAGVVEKWAPHSFGAPGPISLVIYAPQASYR